MVEILTKNESCISKMIYKINKTRFEIYHSKLNPGLIRFFSNDPGKPYHVQNSKRSAKKIFHSEILWKINFSRSPPPTHLVFRILASNWRGRRLLSSVLFSDEAVVWYSRVVIPLYIYIFFCFSNISMHWPVVKFLIKLGARSATLKTCFV